jgi:hypothetical protein
MSRVRGKNSMGQIVGYLALGNEFKRFSEEGEGVNKNEVDDFYACFYDRYKITEEEMRFCNYFHLTWPAIHFILNYDEKKASQR